MVKKQIAILGGGPAGLTAAESLSSLGHVVTVYEAMPTVARKFLLAGKSGLNITHSEDYDRFASRFGASNARLREALDGFEPSEVRAWAAALGTETFVGSSGRVFPTAMKASPLLRAWLRRLEAQGVRILTRHRWLGFSDGGYVIATPEGTHVIQPDAALLALGGKSWPRLGSDAGWLPWLREKGIAVDDFQPANCGFDVDWSDHLRRRFSGEPVKSVTATSTAGTIPGEFVVTRHGIEGSLVYAHAASLRRSLAAGQTTTLDVDLTPGRAQDRIARELGKQDPKASLSNRLRKAAGIDGVKAALLRELAGSANLGDPHQLAGLIKALPIPVQRPRPIAEAISSAGGVIWDEIDRGYMLKALPGLFVAGEMIDWEAPTGGYLLTACFASGRAAALGIEAWLSRA
ncbi:putative flavoprotein (TIGR03862 family) [Rhizobium tibeticum]|uniref:TIGR03862 family flavoprotein n=1 Tax=Rhizobium tibeticum TaxID=501024 RepID=UPI00278A9BC7|nr:TIGR03862 family flavoprotein [Rhizobium tibeticum]MDP9810797.1 putative flavoprotein (TIGR03862 family) [Rhizobium tibeticum]